MRRAFLFRSINRVLGEEFVVREAAYMWIRHRWMVPYASLVLAAVALLAPIGGIDDWPTRIVIGGAAAGVAVTASTDYFVVALVDDRLALLKASRIRQTATGFAEYLPADVSIEPVGGTLLAADWRIGGRTYTVPKSSDSAINTIAATWSR